MCTFKDQKTQSHRKRPGCRLAPISAVWQTEHVESALKLLGETELCDWIACEPSPPVVPVCPCVNFHNRQEGTGGDCRPALVRAFYRRPAYCRTDDHTLHSDSILTSYGFVLSSSVTNGETLVSFDL